MAEAGRDLDLAEEPLRAERGGQLRIQHLDRHLPAVAQVLGQVDGGGASAPELALDLVAAGEGGGHPRIPFGQALRPGRLGVG